MPGSSATAFVSQESGLGNPTTDDGLADTPLVQSFEKLWQSLLDDQKTSHKTLDKEERFSADEQIRAYEIAFQYPEKVEIDQDPFARDIDLTEHVQNHFDVLLNNPEPENPLFKGRVRPDIEYLLKVCELIFIDDAMYRFAESTTFSPKVDGLEGVGFIGMPRGVNDTFIDDWHQDLEILWNVITGELEEGIRVKKEIDRLYDLRKEYIDHCRSHNIFMPITIDTNSSHEKKMKNITRHINRGNRVDTSDVHKYCYLKYLEY
jgi:hypothetical protein